MRFNIVSHRETTDEMERRYNGVLLMQERLIEKMRQLQTNNKLLVKSQTIDVESNPNVKQFRFYYGGTTYQVLIPSNSPLIAKVERMVQSIDDNEKKLNEMGMILRAKGIKLARR